MNTLAVKTATFPTDNKLVKYGENVVSKYFVVEKP